MKRKQTPAPPAIVHAISHECGRCSRIHNGTNPGPGWSSHPDYGKLCDDCSESVQLARMLGVAA